MTLLLSILLLAPAPQWFGDDDPAVRAQIVQAATHLLASRYPDAAHRMAVRVIRASGAIDPEAPLRLDLSLAQAVPTAHVQANVEQPEAGGGWKKAGVTTLYISTYDSIAVPLRDMRPDEPVSRGDFQFAWIETTRFRGQPLTAARFTALQTKGELFSDRFLRPDRPVRVSDLRPAYAVETGQSVTMHYVRRQLKLTLLTKARMPAFTGDDIKLFSPVTNKTYRARITAPGRATWIETLD